RLIVVLLSLFYSKVARVLHAHVAFERAVLAQPEPGCPLLNRLFRYRQRSFLKHLPSGVNDQGHSTFLLPSQHLQRNVLAGGIEKAPAITDIHSNVRGAHEIQIQEVIKVVRCEEYVAAIGKQSNARVKSGRGYECAKEKVNIFTRAYSALQRVSG